MTRPKDKQLFFDTMEIRLAGIKDLSIVDGQGVRYVIFTQGCNHCCPDCHNKHAWDPKGGYLKSINEIVHEMHCLPPYYNGITLSGGEPFDQEDACCFIAKKARDFKLSVWTYTGYTFEQLIARPNFDLLELTDVLVDGPFVKDLKTDIPFVGSYNQRVINLNAVRNLNGGVTPCVLSNWPNMAYSHFNMEHFARYEDYTHV